MPPPLIFDCICQIEPLQSEPHNLSTLKENPGCRRQHSRMTRQSRADQSYLVVSRLVRRGISHVSDDKSSLPALRMEQARKISRYSPGPRYSHNFNFRLHPKPLFRGVAQGAIFMDSQFFYSALGFKKFKQKCPKK